MKKSFKFLAILLSIITSTAGLVQIGAIDPPSGRNIEMPVKRERENEGENLEAPAQRRRLEEEPREESCEELHEESNSELEQIEQRLEERERAANERKNAANRALTTRLRSLIEFQRKMAYRENLRAIIARCLIPGASCEIDFDVADLRFTSEQIRAAYNQNMSGILKESSTCLDFIRQYVDANAANGKTPSQLVALTLCKTLLYLKNVNLVRVLDPTLLLLSLSVSVFVGDPDVPELNTTVPPEEFNVDRVSIRYIHDEMTISCYYRGHKVYESMVGCQC